MAALDPQTKQYLRQLMRSYEQQILDLQAQLEQQVNKPDPVLQEIQLANDRLEKDFGDRKLAKSNNELQKQNVALTKRVQSLEQELALERKLKYLWVDQPLERDYTETYSQVRRMRNQYQGAKR